MKYIKGNIYYADLEPIIGSEQGGVRPVIFLQNIEGNLHNPTVIVAPLTKRMHNKPNLPAHVNLNKFANLKYDSIILLEQIRVIDKSRIKNDFIGRVNEKTIRKINRALEEVFDLQRRRR